MTSPQSFQQTIRVKVSQMAAFLPNRPTNLDRRHSRRWLDANARGTKEREAAKDTLHKVHAFVRVVRFDCTPYQIDHVPCGQAGAVRTALLHIRTVTQLG